MKDIDNKFVKEELENNYETNDIFKHQRHSTISQIEDYLKENGTNEILLDIDINNITPFLKLGTLLKDDDEYWNHVVALLFMQDLEFKYNYKTDHEIDAEKRILSRDIESYEDLKHLIINKNDVFDSIKRNNPDAKRIHIILKYINNENIIDEVLSYIDEESTFTTMIYSDSELPIDKIYNRYKVKVYDKDEDGVLIYKVKTYEKKI